MASDVDPQLVEKLRLELERQAQGILFWDPADMELFRGGPPEATESTDGVNLLVDRFDLEALVRVITTNSAE